MDTAARAHWQHVLTAGGSTALPRWSEDTRTGVLATHERVLDPALLADLAAFADGRGVPVAAVLLAAHARVLASLSGERDIVTGWNGSGTPLPLRLDTDRPAWSDLVNDAARALADTAVHGDAPVTDLACELGANPAPFETTLVAGPHAGPLPEGVVAAAALTGDTLRIRHRTAALDAAAAARFGGYHVAALAAAVAAPGADPWATSLLDDAERRHQLDGLAGPVRTRPDRPAHALFEDRVRAHPDAVAAVHRDETLTYGELNARANRLARALRRRGLGREDIVAVVTERNLDWLTAVLGVLKAGAVYLPVEPHFPAERIATTLQRADCALVLTEPASTGNLPDVDRLLVADAVAGEENGSDLGLPVAGDQAAYVYFTSGSTGRPKGALCEHAGMVNHLFAKIEDLEVGEGDVVAQTAPQCFDISLWQLVAALLVGGRTLIVEQEVILDAARFVDTLASHRVNVAQLVPSYLEAVVTLLEAQPRRLPDLRYVSATGEALKKELVRRWFAVQPGIALVNAYGLTETSDDTNHAVLRDVPGTDRIPLGPPIPNARVHVVDEHLEPVPLGAPGEIVFSGVCVGRGYVNDPERTGAAFLTDPHRPGERLYRSGDQGRWLPGGALEFLGRRDTQVKVRGFRIEIGEIEGVLLRVPGVRDGAVVVGGRGGGGAQLVAFYAADTELDPAALASTLAASLPAYMVPARFHRRVTLPLTGNGKIDRRSLTALASGPAAGSAVAPDDAPRTPTERRLAAAFAAVLDVDPGEIGRHDSFADHGGTSLSAVKLVIALDRTLSLKEVIEAPTLGDLAVVLDAATPDRVPTLT